MDISKSFFSRDYFAARTRFREMAARAGGALEALQIDAKGPHEEDLTIDIAWFGAREPDRVLLHSSGLHGVEGFAGSAVQLQLLSALPPIPANAAMILVHVLNPFGMAWLRRVNPENVDLNRNSIFEPESHAGAPEMYARLDPLLNPPTPPIPDAYLFNVIWTVIRHGMPALKQAVAGGQYEFPRGLFFGGKCLQPELALCRQFLQTRLRNAARIVAIDVHTGLGKYGNDILLVDAPHFETMSRLFGSRVVALDAQRGAAYKVRGGLQSMIFGLNSKAEASFIGQEFGTYHPLRVIHALREENRWHQFGAATLDHPVKTKLKETFCPEDHSWRRNVLNRGKEVLDRAFEILFTGDRGVRK
jgi:hypothetical protein